MATNELVHDPVLKQRYAFTHDNHTGALVVDIEVDPGGAAPRHLHPEPIHERWEVVEGEATFTIGRDRRRAPEGAVIDVAPGVVHAFANDSRVPLRLRATVTPPCGTEDFLREGARLHREGKVTRRGLPTSGRALLEAAAFVERHRDSIVLLMPPPFPPRRLQRLVFGPLARASRPAA